MQPCASPPTKCRKCGELVLTDIVTGEPLERLPRFFPKKHANDVEQRIYHWHICAVKDTVANRRRAEKALPS